MIQYIFFISCTQKLNKKTESNAPNTQIALQDNNYESVPNAEKNEGNLPLKKRKILLNVSKSFNNGDSTQRFLLKRKHSPNNEYVNICDKSTCENTKLQSHKYNQDKNKEKRPINDETFKSDLEILNNQIDQWDFDDDLLEWPYTLKNCHNNVYEVKMHINNMKIIYGHFFSFYGELDCNLTKIESFIFFVAKDEVSKKLILEQLLFFKYCFDYIKKISPFYLHYKYHSMKLISNYSTLPIRLNVLFKKFQLLENFKSLEYALERSFNFSLTNDGKEILGKTYQKLDSLFRSLNEIYTVCSNIVLNLKVLIFKYG
ncbi:uncharacterized protein VNE69_03126 [Vairimorpha necatrix]|uniref:Uncharacterized protein n=1 Tax=Vairimorpha necatrix TaxID=6039 RepID=A0AAX4JAA6_9MICR